jgi:hypothetical protein
MDGRIRFLFGPDREGCGEQTDAAAADREARMAQIRAVLSPLESIAGVAPEGEGGPDDDGFAGFPG